MNYIGGDDLVTYEQEGGVYSGGFNITSIMKKIGGSPIASLYNDEQIGGAANIDNVSDLFGSSLVLPTWLLPAYKGGNNYKTQFAGDDTTYTPEEQQDSFEGGSVIPNDLYEQLLKMVEVTKEEMNKSINVFKKKQTRKQNVKNKNKSTKKHKTG